MTAKSTSSTNTGPGDGGYLKANSFQSLFQDQLVLFAKPPVPTFLGDLNRRWTLSPPDSSLDFSTAFRKPDATPPATNRSDLVSGFRLPRIRIQAL